MNIKNLLLIVALIAGALFPYGHEFTFLIRYTVMAMLLFAFLEVRINSKVFRPSHIGIWVINILIALTGYFSLISFDRELAMTAFITGILPTAAAAAVISGYLRQNVTYVTVSILFTTSATALFLPFLLPLLQHSQSPVQSHEILLPVLWVVFVPLILAQLIKAGFPEIFEALFSIRDLSFYLFILNVYIAMSSASHYIQTQADVTIVKLFWIALLTLLICIINFSAGRLLSPKKFRGENSMALGRKNTMFGVWIALTFIHPITALGPMFYILYQNGWHTWLLRRKVEGEEN